MFLVIFIIAVAMVGLIIYMPYAAKLATYQYEQRTQATNTRPPKKASGLSGNGSYNSPDEILQEEKPVAKATGLKKITVDDIPFKMRVNHGTLKKRTEKISMDKDINTYDYDIDELIREETINDRDVKPSEPSHENVPYSNEIV